MEDEAFKPSLEKQPIPEYSFEAGVPKILERITDILKKQPYTVVAFNASGANVGKTELARTLIHELFQQGIYSRSFHNLDEVRAENIKKKMVFILEQMDWNALEDDSHGRIRRHHNADVVSSLNKLGYGVKGIDLWVGIYRPDLPFTLTPEGRKELLADIVIRNEGATDEYKLNSGGGV